MTTALPTPAFSLPVLVCRMPVHSDFVTFPLYFWIDCDLVDSSQDQCSSWICLGTIFDVLCSQNQSCSSFQHPCANPCSKWVFFPHSQKFLWSLPFAFSGQRGPAQISRGSWRSCILTTVQLAQHLLPYHRRWPQLHTGCSCRQIFVHWSLWWFSHLLS